MSSLTERLQQYYRRLPNRIMFFNGMSLNRLSEEMWEDLGYKSIDASILSKVLRGQRAFTSEQVRSFCKILHISEQEEQELLVESLSSSGKPRRESLERFVTPEYSELIDLGIQTIPFLRQEGSAQRANELAKQQEILLYRHLRETTSSLGKRVIQRSLSKVILEKSRNIAEITHHGQAATRMRDVLSQLETITENSPDQEVYARLCISKADLYYVDQHFEQAATYFEIGAHNLSDAYWKLECLRAYAISLARIGDHEAFAKASDEILSLIQDGHFADSSFLIPIYEGLSRGNAYFKSDKALFFLEEAEKICREEEQKNRLIILPKIQLIRTRLVDLCCLPHTESSSQIERIASSGLALSKSYKYTRQEQEISGLLYDLVEE